MQISEVKIRDTKTFSGRREVNLVFQSPDLPRWIVVAGRNGAGKSTFLQAVALAVAGPSAARSLLETFSGWINNESEIAQAGVRLQFSNSDGFASGGRKPSFSPWASLSWKRAPEGPEPLIENARLGGNWTPQRGPWSENPQGWFLAGYGPFRRLSPAASEAQRLMMTAGRPASLASLFREDASLSESVRWLQAIYLKRLEGDQEAETTEGTVLQLLNDGLLPNGMKVDRVTSEGLWVSSHNKDAVPLLAMSDGYRVVTALVLDLIKQILETYKTVRSQVVGASVTILNEGVVLIDEIDVHLHVEWQQRIGFWLKKHFPNIQFIVTTHSPFICQAADPGGLVRLPTPTEDRPAEIVTGQRFSRIVNGSVDDALLSDLFGLEHSYSDPSSELRAKVRHLEGKAARKRLRSTEQAELESLQAELPKTIATDVALALSRLSAQLESK